MTSSVNATNRGEGASRYLAYPGLLLGGAVLLATSLLALGHVSTRDAIAERLAEDLKASLAQVVPADLHDNDLLNDRRDVSLAETKPRTFYLAKRDAEVAGVAFRTTAPDGYGGPIELILGVDRDGRLLGVRVLAHAETPGLGDKLDIAKSDWIRGFDGRSLHNTPAEDWAVKKDGGKFEQFTGATITPRAVVKAVKAGLELYREQRESLLQPQVEPHQPPSASTPAASPQSAAKPETPDQAGGTGHEQ